MKNAATSIVTLFFLQTLCWPACHASEPGAPKPAAEALKQEKIYQSRGEQVPEGYLVERSLLSYVHTLPADFDRSLAALDPNDRWLDIGAGAGQAILDYYAPRYDAMHAEGRQRRGRKAQAVAISIEDRRLPVWALQAAALEKNQIQYLFGRRLREYSLQELGQFQLITDVTGGFSYTSDLSQFMEKMLGFLKLNGDFYSLLVDVRPENGTVRPFFTEASYLTEITRVDGSQAGVCGWLKSITCVEVTCETRTNWRPPIETFHVRKICDAVKVPALRQVYFEAGTPPARRFQLAN